MFGDLKLITYEEMPRYLALFSLVIAWLPRNHISLQLLKGDLQSEAKLFFQQ